MADAVTSVNIFDAILLYKCVSHAEMAGVVLLAGRNQMVIDQNNLIRIPYLGKAISWNLSTIKGCMMSSNMTRSTFTVTISPGFTALPGIV